MRPARMQVSFIVPLYNCLELTRACIRSLQQTVPPQLSYEIILVDDGSTDGTRHWLGTLSPPCHAILNETNLGYAGANNRGVAAASGEYIVLLNNDLILTRRWLEPMLAAHERLGSRAGFVGNVQRDVRTDSVDHTGIVINYKGKPEHDVRFPRWPGYPDRRVMAATGACLLATRSLFLSLGGFDEGFRNGCEDVDLCLRASALGYVNAVALRSVIGHHISASPGRKQRDEANTRRLALRWRNELAQHGARSWCRHYLRENWIGSTASPNHLLAASALAYAARLRAQPPPEALAGMHAAIDLELARWRELLDHDEAVKVSDSPPR